MILQMRACHVPQYMPPVSTKTIAEHVCGHIATAQEAVCDSGQSTFELPAVHALQPGGNQRHPSGLLHVMTSLSAVSHRRHVIGPPLRCHPRYYRHVGRIILQPYGRVRFRVRVAGPARPIAMAGVQYHQPLSGYITEAHRWRIVETPGGAFPLMVA